MILEDINAIVVGGPPYGTIQNAVNAAANNTPPKMIIIPPTYGNSDTYTNTSGVVVLDLRLPAKNKGSYLPIGTGGASSGVLAIAASAAPITAAAGGTFSTTLNAPGNSVLEGIPFKVKASGWVTFPAGTYTATVQPLIHASTSLGYTASAASAIVSASALTMTITSATATVNTVWESEVEISGDSTTGKLAGKSGGFTRDVNGLGLLVTGAILVAANTPSSINFASTTAPIQFLHQLVLGSGAPADSVVTLNKFYLES